MNIDHLKLEVYMDYIILEGTRVNRPARLSRSRWLAIWGGR